jgi:hypothetical protein
MYVLKMLKVTLMVKSVVYWTKPHPRKIVNVKKEEMES